MLKKVLDGFDAQYGALDVKISSCLMIQQVSCSTRLTFYQINFNFLKEIYSVTFSPDVQTLASGSADKRVRFETRSIVR